MFVLISTRYVNKSTLLHQLLYSAQNVLGRVCCCVPLEFVLNGHASLARAKDETFAGEILGQRITRILVIIRFIRVIRWLQFLSILDGPKPRL
jgi:hypothetical protein